MNLYVIFTKKNLAALLAAVIIIIILAAEAASARTVFTDGATNALRTEYIRGLGYRIDDSPASSKEITVPENFSDVYLNYNKLQQKAGFDLSDYKGSKATVYTYRMTDGSEKNINLIVCGGIIIGGDISDICFDGDMQPLVKKEKR